MTPESRRVVRLMCKSLMLISLPLAGFVWALPETPSMLMAALGLSLLSLLVGFGAEFFASATENDIRALESQRLAEVERRAQALEQRDEKLRQTDRILAMLTEQNHTLRGKLITAQVEVQRRKDAFVKAAGNAIDLEEISALARNPYARAV